MNDAPTHLTLQTARFNHAMVAETDIPAKVRAFDIVAKTVHGVLSATNFYRLVARPALPVTLTIMDDAIASKDCKVLVMKPMGQGVIIILQETGQDMDRNSVSLHLFPLLDTSTGLTVICELFDRRSGVKDDNVINVGYSLRLRNIDKPTAQDKLTILGLVQDQLSRLFYRYNERAWLPARGTPTTDENTEHG